MASRYEARRRRTQEYYERYSVLLNERLLNRSEAFHENLARQYAIAASNIQRDIEAFHHRFAVDNRLDFADARRLLTATERNRFAMQLDEYIRRGQQINFFPDWDLELKNASTTYQLTRLEALQMQIRQQIEELYAGYNGNMRSLMGDIFTDGFERNISEIAKATGNTDPFAALNVNQTEAVLTRPWSPDGTNFSEKIWKDRNQLVNYLDRELTQSLIRGESPDRLIRELQDKFDVTSGQAARLIQTEAAYFSTMSKIESYKAMGFAKYTILAVMDAKTSEICMDMDGEVFDIEDMKVGATAPPFHPFCRTTIAPYADTGDASERSPGLLLDPVSGEMYTIPRDMTPGEWEQLAQNAVENNAETSYNYFDSLTKDEQRAISSYVSSEGYILNEKLRSGGLSDSDDLQWIEMMSNMDTAIEKFPLYQGDISRSVHLRGNEIDSFLASHQPGDSISYKAYTSFTFGRTHFQDANVQIYLFGSIKGRDISSYRSAENEVIFPRNSEFLIVRLEEEDGRYKIYLEEM